MANQVRRKRISMYAIPLSIGERRTRSEYDSDKQGPVHRMTPPPDSVPLTPEQRETCLAAIQRSLEHGCWAIAVACVARASSGVVLLATDEQLDSLRDGDRLTGPAAEIIARSVGVWLDKLCLSAAGQAISRRKTDSDFIGDKLQGTSKVDELNLSTDVARAVKHGGVKTLHDLANRLETWAKFPAAMPNELRNDWHSISHMLHQAGLLQPLATARMNQAGRNSKTRKETT